MAKPRKDKVEVAVPGTVGPVKPQLTLSDTEIAAILKAREAVGVTNETPASDAAAQQSLAQALITAIEATRPPVKKTVFNRKKGSPWDPKDGSPKPKLKRKMFQHGIEIMPEQVSSEEIDALNKVKPGIYCNGFLRVNKRKDRGLDIDYPVRSNAQRLRLINEFGIRSLTELCARIVDEQNNPTSYKSDVDDDY